MTLIDADLHSRVASAWCRHFRDASDPARTLVHLLAARHSVALVSHFYAVMLDDAGANRFLSHELVEDRLAGSLRKWLDEVLLGGDEATIDRLIARQLEIGNVHARIGIPAHLVASGARMIKEVLSGHIDAYTDADEPTRRQAVRYACNIIDLAIEAMIAAYSEARERSVRDDAAYRYFVGLRHIGLERERQQSSLLEWENAVVFQLATGTPLANLPAFTASAFGLWFKHKGEPVFAKDPQSGAVKKLIAECDQALTDVQQRKDADTPEARTTLLRLLHGRVAQIKQLMQSMFEKFMELESGRDELTHLLNRRFLPTVLRREIALADRGQRSFAVLMIDLDHFKEINDRHGHATGDLALQAVAGVIVRNLRLSDYAFRYGGEEFLLVLVETDAEGALTTAERLRTEIAQEPVRLAGGQAIQLSASIGVAVHSGHPDYAHVVDAADAALYRAKAQGRNRVEVALATL